MRPNTLIMGFFGEQVNRKGVVLHDAQVQSIQAANRIFQHVADTNNARIAAQPMSPAEYVDSIQEALFFNKNVVIARKYAPIAVCLHVH